MKVAAMDVNWSGSPPSELAIQIWRAPVRVEPNATRRPSGENRGFVSIRLEDAGHRRRRDPAWLEAVRSSDQMLTRLYLCENASRPSGARAGRQTPSPAEPIREGFPLANTGTRQRRVSKYSPEAMMTSRPSAVHTGVSANRFHEVMRRGSSAADQSGLSRTT